MEDEGELEQKKTACDLMCLLFFVTLKTAETCGSCFGCIFAQLFAML